jgi:hypothetical protein
MGNKPLELLAEAARLFPTPAEDGKDLNVASSFHDPVIHDERRHRHRMHRLLSVSSVFVYFVAAGEKLERVNSVE